MAEQKKSSPPAPTVLSLKTVGQVKETKNGFLVTLVAKLSKGTTVLKNVGVTFKQDATEIGKAFTDHAGEAVYNHLINFDQDNTVINFRAITGITESQVNVIVPKRSEKKAKKKKGPKIMRMSSYHLHGQPGVYIVWAVVQGENGSAYKGRVVFNVRGEHYEVIADHNGYAALTVNPITVLEHEVVFVTATIHEETDGIVDSADITLRRPGNWARAWTREWLETPRGYVGVARWVVMIIWIMFISHALSSEYQPVLMPIQQELSLQQKSFNEIFEDNQIVLPKAQDKFPGKSMMSLIFVTIIVYGLSAMINLRMLRDCVILAYDIFSNKFRGRVSDPLSEKILKWYKLLSLAAKEKHSEKETKEKMLEEKDDKEGLSLSQVFASGMIAEIIGQIVAIVVPVIFSKTKFKKA